ncbi:hypothetical protein CRYUN_Cryun33cG0064300 [Craigia yunnanensis]
MVEHLVKTMASVLSSSINCKYPLPYISILDVKSIEGRITAVSKLHCHLPTKLSLENGELPLRLLFWYLDPLILKQAVSKILQDTRERPVLCLSEKFQQRMDCCAIIICLALAPVMIIETRALLHNWCLKTGLASLLELLVGLVSAILDVISRPTWWGISVELGSKLPFSCAYFPNKSHLLRILAGVFSAENFLHLVHATSEQVSLARKQLHPPIKPTAVEVASIDHKSLCSASADSNASNVLSRQQNVLLRRIPLGILIGCPNRITDDGCELLLHYASAGRIFQPRETVTAGIRHVKHKSERQDLTTWMEKCSKRDVLAGACLVFSLTDAVDSISASLFETEENLVLRDLCNRLGRWRHQGQEILQPEKDIEDVINDLSQK